MKQDRIYFVGAGGIGMANLVRYCLANGHKVAGYDRTSTQLTDTLQSEGADIIFEDNPDLIPENMRDPEHTLIVYTPAVPADNRILSYFRDNGFEIVKRSELLGRLTRPTKAICIAGSHGKTTTCSMTAHILDISNVGCNAFLGGILRNKGTNLLLHPTSEYTVVEADEYDRSFHRLTPWLAVITSTDPDHLDIYGDEEGYLEGFAQFTEKIRPGGILLVHTGLKLHPRPGKEVRVLTYGSPEADCRAENIRCSDGYLYFDYVGPSAHIEGINLGVPALVNVDNAVAAITAALETGVDEESIRQGVSTFRGAKRRFEEWYRSPDHVLIDDYAHSPSEVSQSISSVRTLWPERKITVVFQPHLYSRTRDFAPGFAKALEAADEVILCEIYPAREEPIPGVTSESIAILMQNTPVRCISRKDLPDTIKKSNFDILITMGASDIDTVLPQLKEIIEKKEN